MASTKFILKRTTQHVVLEKHRVLSSLTVVSVILVMAIAVMDTLGISPLVFFAFLAAVLVPIWAITCAIHLVPWYAVDRNSKVKLFEWLWGR